MRYLPVTFARIELLAASLPATRASGRLDERRAGLDGQKFAGHLSGTGWLGWIGRGVTLLFVEGKFAWSAGINAGYKPVAYTTRRTSTGLVFTARAPRRSGDYVDWTGRYDGEALHDVTAVWSRLEQDLVHDLFLPATVEFVFKPK